MTPDKAEQTRQIKAASDLVAVVGQYLALTPAGRTFKALCPFHDDSRPSMDVDPQRQRYKCWSCGASGDVFSFVQHVEKVGFVEARQLLANRAGVKLDEQQTPQEQHRGRLLGVVRWAAEQYQNCLLNEAAAEGARKYVGGRKLAGKTVRDFGLGFAPLGGDWLLRRAAADRVPLDLLVEVGLLFTRKIGPGHLDRFQDRVMFPIRDPQGRPVGFGGRILPESALLPRAPKYYNSSETPLFAKSDILYGLDLARHAAATAGFLAVVEGYTDVMTAHQAGVANVVATMGTALNARHVRQLGRFARKVVLVFDADAAGEKAWHKGMAELLAYPDIEVAVARLPAGLDPADLLTRPGGADEFKAALKDAVNALDFRLDWLLEKHAAGGLDGSRRVIDDLLGVLAAVPFAQSQSTQVKQELIVTRLARRTGVKQETIYARLAELRAEHKAREKDRPAPQAVRPPTAKPPGPAPKPDSQDERWAAAERQLVQLLLAAPGLVPTAAAAIAPGELSHPGLRRLLTELYAIHEAGAVPDLEALRERLPDRPDLFEAADRGRLVGETMGREPEEKAEWLGRVLRHLVDRRAEAERRAVREALGAAGDAAAAADLLRKLQMTA